MAQALASVGATSPDVEVDHTNVKNQSLFAIYEESG